MKNKICLVRPLIAPYEYSGIPLNLLILGAVLDPLVEVKVLDYDNLKHRDEDVLNTKTFNERIVKDILNEAPKYVAITTMCNNYLNVLNIAKQLKDNNNDIIIILGGPQASMTYIETIKEYKYIDYVIVGEGESTIYELIQALESKMSILDIDGICYRINNKIIYNGKRDLLIDLDNSPVPEYSLINMKNYIHVNPKVALHIGTGCPYNCIFCTTSLMWEKKYRTKSVDRIIEEIILLKETYGVTYLDFIHDNLTSNRKFILSLFKKIIDLKLDISFEFSSRVDTIDNEIIDYAAEAGCTKIFFGIEHIDNKIQNDIGKKLKIDSVYEVIESCNLANIKATTSFILGFPDENYRDLNSNIAFAFKTRILSSETTLLNQLSVYSGSRLLNQIENKLVIDTNKLDLTMSYFLDKSYLSEIKKNKSIYCNYYSIVYSNPVLNKINFAVFTEFAQYVIEKLTYSFNFLLNIVGIEFIDIFLHFQGKLSERYYAILEDVYNGKLSNLKLDLNITKNEYITFCKLKNLDENQIEQFLKALTLDILIDKMISNENNDIMWDVLECSINPLIETNKYDLFSEDFHRETKLLVSYAYNELTIAELNTEEYVDLNEFKNNNVSSKLAVKLIDDGLII